MQVCVRIYIHTCIYICIQLFTHAKLNICIKATLYREGEQYGKILTVRPCRKCKVREGKSTATHTGCQWKSLGLMSTSSNTRPLQHETDIVRFLQSTSEGGKALDDGGCLFVQSMC